MALRGPTPTRVGSSLTREGLAEFHSGHTAWVLTPRGAEVYLNAARADAGTPAQGKRQRLTVRPDLSDADRERLHHAQFGQRHTAGEPSHQAGRFRLEQFLGLVFVGGVSPCSPSS
ncbi:hypothetical protein [Haloactinospora alba]|uniref:hypothetical protein n=1 Tax=Haloactinospora alba TaxID=405555 RepID=UPI00115439E5|nr:hypothetical protein [Haloactinospora alba]